jgi:archaellum component FlaF (FlaF/FlaG flagellin family)
MLCICVMAFLVYGILGVSAPDLEASAAAKKYTVTVTIKMGNSGSSCPELRFVKNGKTYIAQAVSKWYIDGKYTKDPWSRFYSKGWKFKKHKITVVMKKKLPKGSYKVSMDNGSKVKSLGKVKVKSKAVKKTFKFA